jgi:hypothetical protein
MSVHMFWNIVTTVLAHNVSFKVVLDMILVFITTESYICTYEIMSGHHVIHISLYKSYHSYI